MFTMIPGFVVEQASVVIKFTHRYTTNTTVQLYPCRTSVLRRLAGGELESSTVGACNFGFRYGIWGFRWVFRSHDGHGNRWPGALWSQLGYQCAKKDPAISALKRPFLRGDTDFYAPPYIPGVLVMLWSTGLLSTFFCGRYLPPAIISFFWAHSIYKPKTMGKGQ